MLQVDKFDVCVVFNETQDGYKLSVRSCIKEVNASELVQFLTDFSVDLLAVVDDLACAHRIDSDDCAADSGLAGAGGGHEIEQEGAILLELLSELVGLAVVVFKYALLYFEHSESVHNSPHSI